MFTRPSQRRKSHGSGVEINLVPMMDALVTMVAFLMFSMSILEIVSIESVVPIAGPDALPRALNEKPLQLTISFTAKDTEIWSPFNKIASRRIAHTPEGEPNLEGIHGALIEIKQKFPTEVKVILAPTPQTPYDVLIAVMDTVRLVEPTDPAIFSRNAKTGIDEQVNLLFPEIVFGNLLGDG